MLVAHDLKRYWQLNGIVTLSSKGDNNLMHRYKNCYRGYYFTLSFRDNEELLAVRRIQASYESIRCCSGKKLPDHHQCVNQMNTLSAAVLSYLPGKSTKIY